MQARGEPLAIRAKKRGEHLILIVLTIAYSKRESITWKGGVHFERGRSVGSKGESLV